MRWIALHRIANASSLTNLEPPTTTAGLHTSNAAGPAPAIAAAMETPSCVPLSPAAITTTAQSNH